MPQEDQPSKTIHLDKLGISLSLLCALHCILTPLIVLSIPLMARYFLLHPYFHVILSLLIVPVGSYAFWRGYKGHHDLRVFYFGIPGLLAISLTPYLVHHFQMPLSEPLLMIPGSLLLVYAHWKNYHLCRCELHS